MEANQAPCTWFGYSAPNYHNINSINSITDNEKMNTVDTATNEHPNGSSVNPAETVETAEAAALVISRTFDAPRALVWQVWTQPEHLVHWWGPENFTAPVCKVDFRVGGRYLFCMRSPEGEDYWSTGVYREIVEPERFVCTDAFADEHGNPVPASHYAMPGDWPDELLVTVILEEREGNTQLTLRQTGIPSGQMTELTSAGWQGSFDKMVQYLNELSA